LRCPLESFDPRNDINRPSLYYITPKIRKEILSLSGKYHSTFRTRPNVHDVVGKLTGFKLEIVREIAGNYDFPKKIIRVNPDNSRDKTICHEIGHHIQRLTDEDLDYRRLQLSQFITKERQAESIGYYLYQCLFGQNQLAYPENNWIAYFNVGSAQWLYDYYGGWLEDDICEIPNLREWKN
jgi:hypothetical protein